jgi:hypothetical protein
MALELRDKDDLFDVKDSEIVPDGGDPETTYTLRPLLIEAHREIIKRNTEYVVNKRTHQREPKVNWDGVADDLFDHIIAGWSGIVHKGVPLPCDRANKMRLDAVRKDQLLERAGYNEVTRPRDEVRAESFREPA